MYRGNTRDGLEEEAMENQQIKQAGLKVTLPRVKILQLLEDSKKRHVSAEDVYKLLLEKGEEIGLATVYRVLTQFESAGLVCRHNFEGGQSVFELNRGAHHDHLVCVNCGKVIEFEDENVALLVDCITRRLGFRPSSKSMRIEACCDKLRSEGVCENLIQMRLGKQS